MWESVQQKLGHTKPDPTLFLFKSIWMRPQDSRGVKNQNVFFKIKLLSFSTKIEQELRKLQKTVKIEKKKSSKNHVF